MNILPKKRWHVRTKDNIARVRRDEAEAKELEQKRQEKLLLAESEARINFLRRKSGASKTTFTDHGNELSVVKETQSDNQQNVDLFSDYKTHIKKTNKALEQEKKEEQEKYEKQIGYLTYLGQDTNEALKLQSWYEKAPIREEIGDRIVHEKDLKNKHSQDPLTLINALLPAIDSKTIKDNSSKRAHEEETTASCTSPPQRKKKKSHNEDLSSISARHKKRKKHKKHKQNKKEKCKKQKYFNYESDTEELQRLKQEKLLKLRKERLDRETSERLRQEALLAPMNSKQDLHSAKIPPARIVQKYNSQFNPELAKQNMM
uniref:Leukocyte receptor cluster member 1 n=1 Tax=Ceratitis capitata TaxID=7213 RepID=W8C1Y2_CERCA